MATQKRQRKIRDKALTKDKLVKGLGTTLTIDGSRGLNAEKVARAAGYDSKLIRDYFGNLKGLERAYIMENDYWIPFLERFTIAEHSSIDEIQTLFSALMKENFRFFSQNTDMQNIILWQITEDNELIREISEDRERRGELLFRMTDPSFSSSDVNFRAVTGLLLGGIYFMVLQSRSIKSKVCGINVAREEDQMEVLKTVEQIISWACAASKNQEQIQQLSSMDDYDFQELEVLVSRLATSPKEARDRDSSRLKFEIKKLNKLVPRHLLSLNSPVQISSFLTLTINRLSDLADQLFEWKQADHYHSYLFVDLLSSVFQLLPGMIPAHTRLPAAFCYQQTTGLNARWQGIKLKLEMLQIDPFLTDIMFRPMSRFVKPGLTATWADYTYLLMYLNALEKGLQGPMTEHLLHDLLISLNFNHARYSAYYTAQLISELSSKNETQKKHFLTTAKIHIQQINLCTDQVYNNSKTGIIQELSKWMEMELTRPETPVDLSNQTLALITSFNVKQFALWRKLEQDAGIYAEANLDVLADKLAANFSTKGREKISALSIKSKWYSKEREVFKSLEGYAVKILEDIRRFL